VDNPFFDDNFTNPGVAPEPYNVTWAIDQFVRYLSKDHPDHNDPQIQPIFGEGFNLRLLIHYVGDIHQPLHTVNRYTKSNPNGDEGGNDFQLKTKHSQINELHALWDSVITEF